MKKTLAMLLAVLMLFSMVSAAIPAYAVENTGMNTLSENNVGIQVPYFSGSVYYNETTGRIGRNLQHDYTVGEESDEDMIVEKSGDSKIVLDGVISDGEWGIPLIDISSEYAAQKKSSTSPSAENTYYSWIGEDGDNQLNLSAGLKYKVWMAWDEYYLYVAAEVTDPDAPKLTDGGENVWDGDCFQMRIDPEGPNSIVNGGSYDPVVNKYPFKSSDKTSDASETYAGLVSNIGIGYTDGGVLSVQDMALRYSPSEEEVLDASGNVDYVKTVWNQHSALYDADDENPFGSVVASFWSESTKNASNKKEYLTVYEYAIPWHYIDGSYIDYNKETGEYTVNLADYTPEAGDEFGVSIALLNAGRSGSGYNSYLAWGSGVCGSQVDSVDFVTAGGSNSMLLVSDELGTTGCDGHVFTEPDCTHPYVCTKCGYEKGYSTGHTYTHEVVSTPTTTTDGAIVSTCTVCGNVHTAVLPATEKEVWAEFNGKAEGEWEGPGYEYLYADDDGYPIMDPTTGRQKNVFEEYDGKTVVAMYDDYPGTYLQCDSDYTTYSYSYSFRFTGDTFPEESINEGYADGIYSWFGGAEANDGSLRYGLSYVAGFFPDAHGSTTGVFRIVEGTGARNAETGELIGTVLAESETIDLGTDWHTFNFVFDQDTNTALMYCDGEVMCGAWDVNFNTNGNGTKIILRRFHISFMMSDMAIGNTTAFVAESAEPTPTTYTVTCDGTVIGTYEAGETVTLPVPAFKASTNSRFYTWKGDGVNVSKSSYKKSNGTSNGRTYTMVMPAQNVELTSQYVKVGDCNSDNRLNARDTSALKKAIAGTTSLSAVGKEAADTNLDGRMNATDIVSLKKGLASGSFTK